MKSRPNYYSVLPANVRYDNDLTDSEKILYSEIVALANQNGECWAGNTYFSELYNVTTETISRRISKLRKKGYIEVEIKYKNKTKQIDKRVIKINDCSQKSNRGGIDAKINTSPQNNQGGIDRKINRGIDANVKGNNTSNEYYKINNKPYNPLKMFDAFWEAYPKKRNKGQAKRAFKKNVKDEKTLKLILKDLKRRQNFYDWIKNDGQFIPYPSTYLNAHAWLDEYTTEKPKSKTYKQQHIKHHVSMPDYSKNVEIEEDTEELKAEIEKMLKDSKDK